jgi:hypothetical protein
MAGLDQLVRPSPDLVSRCPSQRQDLRAAPESLTATSCVCTRFENLYAQRCAATRFPARPPSLPDRIHGRKRSAYARSGAPFAGHDAAVPEPSPSRQTERPALAKHSTPAAPGLPSTSARKHRLCSRAEEMAPSCRRKIQKFRMFVCPAPRAYVGPELRLFRTDDAHRKLALVFSCGPFDGSVKDAADLDRPVVVRTKQVHCRGPHERAYFMKDRRRERSAQSHPVRPISIPRIGRVRNSE